MGHREDIRAYLEGLTVSGMVVDWGSGSKPVQKYVKGVADFINIDKNPQTSPDILADIQNPIPSLNPFAIQLADYAFCIEVLEHTTDPLAVLKNIHYNLKTEGKLYLSVPFLYPEHGEEDYLRFTSMGLKYYLEKAGFKDITIKDITDGFWAEATA